VKKIKIWGSEEIIFGFAGCALKSLRYEVGFSV